MSEPITTVGVGVIAAYLGKDVTNKLLGPTADYLGGELKSFARRRVENVRNIFSNAVSKLADRINSPGQVPPKVLKAIIDDGSYAEDPVALEYFGGVLASSRTEVGRDDRGARLVRLTDSLSAYQIRTHYILYSTIAQLFSNAGKRFGLSSDRAEMQVFLPIEGYSDSMEFSQVEFNNLQIMDHIWHGLFSENLIEDRWQFDKKESLRKIARNVQDDGIICQPSASGAELFLWAFGHGDKPLDFMLSGYLNTEIANLPNIVPGAMGTKL